MHAAFLSGSYTVSSWKLHQFLTVKIAILLLTTTFLFEEKSIKLMNRKIATSGERYRKTKDSSKGKICRTVDFLEALQSFIACT